AIKRSQEVIEICEGAPAPLGLRLANPTYAAAHHVATWESFNEATVSPSRWQNVAYQRHRGGKTTWINPLNNQKVLLEGTANYVFMDGHVERRDWGATWQPIGPAPAGASYIGPSQNCATPWRSNFDMVQNAKQPNA